MYWSLLGTAMLALPTIGRAVEPESFYYLGEVKLSGSAGQPLGSQAILFEKIHDPDHAMMTERAITVRADGRAEEHTMRLAVKDNSFTLTDDAKTIEGSGVLAGPAWKWTYFKAAYKAKNGVQRSAR